jgi:hypothetical protein
MRYTLCNNKRELSRTAARMAKIAFILLCHKNPEAIIRQAERLTETGDCVRSISTPARPPPPTRIHDALKDRPGVTFARGA